MQSVIKIRKKYSRQFYFASKCHKISKNIIKIIEQNLQNYSKQAERICIALFTQTARLHNAVLILSKKSFDQEAVVLTRSLVETSSYLLYISECDHIERADLYRYSRDLSDAKYIRRLNSMCPQGEQKVDESSFIKRENDALEYFKNKFGRDKNKEEIKRDYVLKARNAAKQLKGDNKSFLYTTYGIFYSPASSIVHGENPLGFIGSKNGKLYLIKYSESNVTKICLQTTTLLTLKSIEQLKQMLKIKNKFKIESVLSDFFKLLEENQR